MTQEQKDLLFKDLCARLPYGVKLKVKHYDDVWKLLAIYTNGTIYTTRDVGYPVETYFEDCKPYLFPLDSMTEEQKKEYNRWKHDIPVCHYEYGDVVEEDELWESPASFEYLIANHFDDKGLIERGLAIDATNLNIY